MDSMISYCGLVCSECPAFLARRDDDSELRKRTAAEWSAMYGADVKPEHIDCDGCTASGGVHTPHCFECEMRSCGQRRSVPNCGRCEDFAGCPTINGFLSAVPGARAVLEKERNGAV